MKIKIIDLLNKIADGKELPKKFMCKGHLYYRQKTKGVCYRCDELNEIFEECFVFEDLNDTIEIIEEPKKIEKLDVALLSQCDNWLRCPTNEVTKQDIELNPYIIENIRENTLYFQRKINELIDEINNLKEK